MGSTAAHLRSDIDAAVRHQNLTRTQPAAHTSLSHKAVTRVFRRARADPDTVDRVARMVGLCLVLVPDNNFADLLAAGML